MATKLFKPARVGAFTVKHRVVLAPLTRVRSSKAGVPFDYVAEYYGQRASDGGLLVSEGTFIAEEAGGLGTAPGVYSAEQIKAWKPITDAVHAKGGLIFAQLWALGRTADPDIVSTVWSAGTIRDSGSKATTITPLAEADLQRFIGHYGQAAKNSIEAGFDGVEIHGANGYLIDQFLQTRANDRTDQYGGSLENRFRFPLQVLKAVCDAIGPDRVGIRMSPFSQFQGMREAEPLALFVPWAKAIVKQQPKLAYIHATEARADIFNEGPVPDEDKLDAIRDVVEGAGIAFIAAGGHTPETAIQRGVETNDLVAFGRHFISNPDLPARIKNGWPLNEYDRSTFYAHCKEGYIDYPFYNETKL